MKILLVSDNKLFGHGGGCLEERKYYDGLKAYALEHGHMLKIISPDERFEDSLCDGMSKSRQMDMKARLLGHSTYVYCHCKAIKEVVRDFHPDIIVLGRSRLGFLAKAFRKMIPVCKIIVNMENVEYDYVDGYFTQKKGIAKKLYVTLEKACVWRDERTAIRYANAIDYLTERDQARTHALYPAAAQKREMILPICTKHARKIKTVATVKSVVFIGSLSYQSNIEAITAFVTDVWERYFAHSSDIQLIVGGSKPSDELRTLLSKVGNCTLYSNFKSLSDIVPLGSMMIAPIQHGAGMKVKVAETLSMGLMIAASDEALVGYEQALEQDSLGGIVRANTSEEYRTAIDAFCKMSKKELDEIAKQNIALYEALYSYQVSRKAIAQLCDEMQNNLN